ncbi:hypothetical protein OY671_010858, partial [Metschnikowia pulcherrima]
RHPPQPAPASPWPEVVGALGGGPALPVAAGLLPAALPHRAEDQRLRDGGGELHAPRAVARRGAEHQAQVQQLPVHHAGRPLFQDLPGQPEVRGHHHRPVPVRGLPLCLLHGAGGGGCAAGLADDGDAALSDLLPVARLRSEGPADRGRSGGVGAGRPARGPPADVAGRGA